MRKHALAAALAATVILWVWMTFGGREADVATAAETAGAEAPAASPPDAGSNPDSIAMAFVEGGTLALGCTEEELKGCCYDYRGKEYRADEVTLDDFLISRYEVTWGLWKAVMDSLPSGFRGKTAYSMYLMGDDYPVSFVNWYDAQEFIEKLNARTGREYRLPWASEWEYAARGGKKSKGYSYSGGNDFDSVAWNGNNSGNMPHPVGTKQANELGIHDMSGNVWEWTNTAEDSARVLRGCGWMDANCCVGLRGSESPTDYRDVYDMGFGFRLALYAPDTAKADSVWDELAGIPDKPLIAALKMVFVEGGKFPMGCTTEQFDDCRGNEKPAHRVTVSDFYIGKYEVTQKLWTRVMGANPSRFTGNGNLPVESVSWYDVQRFIGRLNAKTGRRYRLPTEAEWEYAARGGNKGKRYKYSGGDTVGRVAWYDLNCCNDNGDDDYSCYGDDARLRTRPVGAKRANELGIHDMSGNVSEWVSDWFWYYGFDEQTDPPGPRYGTDRVARGGDWLDNAQGNRVSVRSAVPPGARSLGLGFRLAHDN